MKIGVLGCNGRVGKQLLNTLYNNDPACLGGCLESFDSSVLGNDIGTLINKEPLGIKITSRIEDLAPICDVFIDFTNNISAVEHTTYASKINKPIVIGATGFQDDQEITIKKLSKNIPIVKSSNMSLGVNVLFKLVECAAKVLNKELYDIEILETHHKNKKDAPSGTALTIGNLIAKIREEDLKDIIHSQRKGLTSGREANKIAFHSIRGGSSIGAHSVLFLGDGETIELKHTSNSRNIFVNGAIKAAKWIVGKPNGLYSFSQVINKIYEE